MAQLTHVLIDDVTWFCATRARRAEWEQTIAELITESSFEAPAGSHADPPQDEAPPIDVGLRGYITVHKAGIQMALHDQGGREVGRLDLPEGVIAPVFKEYMGIVRDMIKRMVHIQSPHFEALDIAKRLIHDDAAEIIEGRFMRLRPDHATARRLFTLLVELTHDTSKLGASQKGQQKVSLLKS